MTLKLVLFSVDGTLCRNGKIDKALATETAELIKALDNEGVRSVFWSNKSWTVNSKTPLNVYFSDLCGVDIVVHGMHNDKMPNRTSANSVQPLLDKYGVARHETILVGSSQNDLRAGVNNRLLLIRTDWYGQQLDYGFPVNSVSELARFLFVFALRKHPIFWQVRTGSGVDISAAGPFSTFIQNYAVFGGDARAFAKAGSGHPDFWFLFTVSSVYFSGLLDGVDYIATYPSHDPKSTYNAGMGHTLTLLGQCFRKGYYQDLILRHQLAQKSQPIKAVDRTYSNQLHSICLNKRPTRNNNAEPNRTDLSLRGKRVLLVDDFCTSGRSIESARAFLSAAGATMTAYCWLKTISVPYEEMSPLPAVAPYAANPDLPEPGTLSHSYHASIIDQQAPAEIQAIFEKYRDWTWP
jgi:hypoxanthine phosphoribosyltransferase